MNVGVVGSGKFKNKSIVLQILESKINKKEDIIVSGHSPRNTKKESDKGDNVDIWAEEWAFEHCYKKPNIRNPKTLDSEGFFARNKEIADISNVLFVFINENQYRSGAWNTVKWFTKKSNFRLKNLYVFNERGKKWKKLPSWIRENNNESLLDF